MSWAGKKVGVCVCVRADEGAGGGVWERLDEREQALLTRRP